MQAKPNYLTRSLFCFVLLLASGCASLPENVYRTESFAYTDTATTRLGKSRSAEKRAHPGQSGFLLLNNGLDAFVARALLAQGADRSIDAQYYLLHNDLTGALFIDQLIKAADRGVRVRLLVDDMDLAGRDVGAAILDNHPNMEVRIFNPFIRKSSRGLQLVTRFGSVTRRMHNKSFTTDNQVTILGGRNIGDEYFGADSDLDYSDLDVLAIGPVVNEVSASFDRFWNSELAYPAMSLVGDMPPEEDIEKRYQTFRDYIAEQVNSPYMQALRNSDLTKRVRRDQVKFIWGEARIVSDQPEKLLNDKDASTYHLAPQLRPFFREVRDELMIISPYFVPARSGTDFLMLLADSGIRVRILTNSLGSNDVPIVHSAYAKYRKDLLRSGVELYEVSKVLSREQRRQKSRLGQSSSASLHAKSFVFDRDHVFIGSLNLDPRSVYENTEIGVVLDSVEIANDMAGWFEKFVAENAYRLELTKNNNGVEQIVWYGTENGVETTYHVEPHTNFSTRFSNGLTGLLPIESQL